MEEIFRVQNIVRILFVDLSKIKKIKHFRAISFRTQHCSEKTISKCFIIEISFLAQYKRSSCRQELSADLSKRIFFCGLVNLMLMPVIFCWTFIFTFFNYFGVIRREPGKLFGPNDWAI